MAEGIPFIYSAGNITLSNGSATAIGQHTAWVPALQPNDLIFINGGLGGIAVIDDVISQEEMTLVQPWAGPDIIDDNYFVLRFVAHTNPMLYGIRVSDYLTRIRGIPQTGPNGWCPVLSAVADGDRVVMQIADWIGGYDPKPVSGAYIGATGLISEIAEAVDFRGLRGFQGERGEQGERGIQGIQGIQGERGERGETGDATTPGSVTNSVLADMPANTIKARVGTAGGPQDLSPAQSWDLIGPAGKASAALVIEGVNDKKFITPAQLRANSGWRIINIISATTPLAVAVITVPDDVRALKISGVTQSTLADIGVSGPLLAQVSYDGGITWVTDNAYYSGWAGRQSSGSDNTFSSSTSIGNSFTLSSNSSYRDSPAITNALLHLGSVTTRFVYQSTTSAREIGLSGSHTSFSAWSLHGFMRDVGRITNLRLFPHNGLIDVGSQIIIEGC